MYVSLYIDHRYVKLARFTSTFLQHVLYYVHVTCVTVDLSGGGDVDINWPSSRPQSPSAVSVQFNRTSVLKLSKPTHIINSYHRKHSGSRFYKYDITGRLISSDLLWFADTAVQAAGIVVCFCLHWCLDCGISDFLLLFDL